MKKIVSLTLVLLAGCLAVRAQEKNSVAVLNEPKPVSIGIVVDNSASFRLAMNYVIDTTTLIAGNVGAGDEGFLVRFISKDKIGIMQDFTGNKDLLAQASEEMYVEGGLTAIPEALLYSAKHLLAEGKNERKILIMITDGDSKSDKKIVAEAVNFLKENKIPVFIVEITTQLETNIGESKRAMEKLASETGGAVVLVDRKVSAAEAANALIKAIRAQ